jgi:hypothetical protein
MARWKWKELGWRPLLPRLLAVVRGLGRLERLHDPLDPRRRLGCPGTQVSPLKRLVCMTPRASDSVLFFGWLCLYFFYHLFDRLNRSEIERFQLMSSVKEAELRALKSQVNPHFIFNSLNSLRALIDEDPPGRARP